MPEIPGPPDDYSDAERRAWLEGAATVAEMYAYQTDVIAARYAGEMQNGTDDVDESDEDDDTCDECGAAKIDSFDGPICLDCDGV